MERTEIIIKIKSWQNRTGYGIYYKIRKWFAFNRWVVLGSSSGSYSNNFELSDEDMGKISKFIMEEIIKNKRRG